MMEQYYNTKQCPIQPVSVNRIGKRHHPLQSNTECYYCGLSLMEVKSERIFNSLLSFFAKRISIFVLQNSSTYEIAHSCSQISSLVLLIMMAIMMMVMVMPIMITIKIMNLNIDLANFTSYNTN